MKDAASGCAPAFARLEKAGDAIQPGGVYKSVKPLDGWLVTNVTKGEVQQKPNTKFTWEVRDESDVREDHKRLASDILMALDTRVNSLMSDNSLAVLQVFDVAALVKLHCGSSSNRTVKLAVSDGDYDAYGIKECEAVLAVASKMPKVKQNLGTVTWIESRRLSWLASGNPCVLNGFFPKINTPLHYSRKILIWYFSSQSPQTH